MGLFKALVIGTKVAFQATGLVVKGTAKSIQTAGLLANAIGKGDAVGATRIVSNKIAGMAVTGCTVAKNVDDILDRAEKYNDQTTEKFLNKDTEKKLIACASLGTAFVAGGCLASSIDADTVDTTIDSDSETEDSDFNDTNLDFNSDGDLICPAHGSNCTAIFNPAEDDLSDLIGKGEIDHTEHLSSDEIHRSMSVRAAFLHEHGYDSVPNGYEVHHIQPLSEGGHDSIDNMVLIDEEDHDKITAAHRQYYGWNN